MIRFAAMLAALPRDRNALPLYLQQATEADRDACLSLLNGQRPRRIAKLATLLVWAAEIAEIPDWLAQTSLDASGDRAETAAFLLPPPTGTPPTLAETLQALATTTPITAHRTIATLWSLLPPEANLILNRLASGTFRTGLPASVEDPATPGTCLAVLTTITPAGPEAAFALRQRDSLVPLTRLPLTLPETAEILAWTRDNTIGRFGPSHQVTPTLVFEIAFRGTRPNPRRRCGFDLLLPEVVCWHRDLGPDSTTQVEDFDVPA